MTTKIFFRQYYIVLAFYKFCTKTYATSLFDATKTDNRFKLNKKLVFGLHKKTFYFLYLI